MCLLVESIKISGRSPENLDGHNVRMNRSRSELFGLRNCVDLRDFIKIPGDLGGGIYKCRVVYAEEVKRIEFNPYIPRKIRNLELVEGGDIEYRHKYLDRSALELLKARSVHDDVLIVKNGRITDASSANVVFFEGSSWLTPARPLLEGTRRRSLLDAGLIREDEILSKDIGLFKKAVLINAMLEFDPDNYIPAENIFYR
jgi:4-amino-4-deoxychorismate lyase